ncbi:hypothetical protein HNP84_010301 [Thermocatellispora tengchongensis]|uniref:Uncharacterized protein n=1 Tax=Thermocatellispora tengchongensis TaxID=1073253 RepID=A0A840PQZ6_9ACTN|nr:hypothetical protein [Thermocatellispora tengchongensis]MBB5140533.1 hypothetical protein [Thermocatellispora tengchongensis]
MQVNTNPAALFDAIEDVTAKHPKTFARMGVSRPIGFVVIGLAASGRLDELTAADNESSIADRILTGDELADLPAECIATRGTGKNAVKFSTYALIGMHVAAQVGFGQATLTELGKVPGTSAPTVQKLLAELPTMAEYRKEIEARRKAAAKRAADVAAVRLTWKFAEKFKAPHTADTYDDVMSERGLTWEQVSEIIAALTREADAKTEAEATDEAKANA